MFIQVIQGQVNHAEPVYVELDQWVKELARGAEGWLGTTAGVTSDDRAIVITRFASEQAARANSARPEQDHWWKAFGRLFPAEPTFDETADVIVDTPGEPDQARFVQVLRGRGRGGDLGRARELVGANSAQWAAARPELLGSLTAFLDGGRFVTASWFTDVDAARAGERRELPPDLKAQMDELMSLGEGPLEYFDLDEPWLHSAT